MNDKVKVYVREYVTVPYTARNKHAIVYNGATLLDVIHVEALERVGSGVSRSVRVRRITIEIRSFSIIVTIVDDDYLIEITIRYGILILIINISRDLYGKSTMLVILS